jgi:hypothetical protein
LPVCYDNINRVYIIAIMAEEPIFAFAICCTTEISADVSRPTSRHSSESNNTNDHPFPTV